MLLNIWVQMPLLHMCCECENHSHCSRPEQHLVSWSPLAIHVRSFEGTECILDYGERNIMWIKQCSSLGRTQSANIHAEEMFSVGTRSGVSPLSTCFRAAPRLFSVLLPQPRLETFPLVPDQTAERHGPDTNASGCMHVKNNKEKL